MHKAVLRELSSIGAPEQRGTNGTVHAINAAVRHGGRGAFALIWPCITVRWANPRPCSARSKPRSAGWRVRVYWEGDDEWFEGIVRAYSCETGCFVEYDDGEEQWEAENPQWIEFLTKPISSSTAAETARIIAAQEQDDEEEDAEEGGSDEQASGNAGKWSAEPPPSTTQLESPTAYDDDDYEEEEDPDDGDDHDTGYNSDAEQVNAQTQHGASRGPQPGVGSSPSSRTASADKGQTAKPQQPRDPTKYVTSGLFLRDAESLREAKLSLQREKHELKQQYDVIAQQLHKKEELSISIKRELTGLKAQVTLASLTGRGASSSSGRAATPNTVKDWAKRVVTQKAVNNSVRQELSALQSQLQQKKATVHQMERQSDQLTTRLARVPRKELQSLVDIQMEIAQLMNDKRALEAACAKSTGTSTGSRGATAKRPSIADKTESASTVSSGNTKADLEKELRMLDQVVARVRDEVDEWKQSYDEENARIAPLQRRLESLQQELPSLRVHKCYYAVYFCEWTATARGRSRERRLFKRLRCCWQRQHQILRGLLPSLKTWRRRS